MGYLKNGQWCDGWYETHRHGGEFVREDAQFRHWVTVDGSPGPTGEGGFMAEAGRYHLYVSLACPWAHRTLIFRELKGLQDIVSLSIVEPEMLEHGWVYDDDGLGSGDDVNHVAYHYQLYTLARPDYSGRATVPVLWDKQRRTIVNNESADIIRMFNSAFSQWADVTTDYYPASLREAIDAINSKIYSNINNGVYRCGFTPSQRVYERAFDRLFAELDSLESLLSQQRYLVGNRQTEADWRLFTTLIRFDAVYYSHFKCNWRRIIDYPNLSNYLRDLYQVDGVAGTVSMTHIKRHYYYSHTMINPTQIVPKGPLLDFTAAHDRDRFTSQ